MRFFEQHKTFCEMDYPVFPSKTDASAVFILMAAFLCLCVAGCGTETRQAIATAPAASLSSRSLAFAPARVGTAEAGAPVMLTNSGGRPLMLSSFVLSDEKDFRLASTCGSELLAGESCTLTVQFLPQSAATLTGTLTITDNDGGVNGQQQIVVLNGTGTPVPVSAAVLTPGTLNFGQAIVHSPVAAQTVTVSNTGTASLAISGYSTLR